MKHYSFHVFIIYLILSSVCSSSIKAQAKREDNIKISQNLRPSNLIKVNLDSLELKVGRYSDIYDKIVFIPLEFKPEAIIGQIEDIQLFNDTIYVLDSQKAKSIFVFTLKGKFIRRIGNTGRGPGEWLNPSSFTIAEAIHRIYILDDLQRRIFVYSTNGSFKKTIDFPDKDIWSRYIIYQHGKLYMDANNRSFNENIPRYLLRQIGLDGIEEKRWLPVPDYSKGWIKEPPYFVQNSFLSLGTNDIKFVEYFMDTIFSISEQGVRPAIVLKTKDLLTQQKLKRITETKNKFGDFFIASMQDKFVWGINSYVENEDIIRFRYYHGNMRNEIYINKKTKLIHNFSSLENDLLKDKGPDKFNLEPLWGNKKVILGLAKIINSPHKTIGSTSDSSLTNNPILYISKTK